MKKKQQSTQRNPYATNRGGKISAPASPTKGEVRATVIRGDDLRK